MRNTLLLALAVAALPSAVLAQETRIYRSEPMARGFAYSFGTEDDEDRAVIGITTSSGSARDTLGILIGSIQPGGPAEKAGLEEGNRIASINGVNLRLAAADVGDWDVSGALQRRFTREMGKLKAGDEVDLRVYTGAGQFKNVKLKTVAYVDLYRSQRRVRFDADDRAALGVSLGSSGSKRDTLGVLIVGLNDDGPAAKAGLEEGNRIAAIGAVDLRVGREDAGDGMLAGVKVQRLQRELEKLKPGDEVELKIYSEGRTRTLKIKTVPLSDLNRGRTRSIMIDGWPRGAMVAPVPPVPPVAPTIALPGRIGRIAM
jgi:predicted metalloprotease with PDZ domain